MKTVDSHNIEFGYELLAVIPYAYYLHTQGELKQTISGKDTQNLYYFSPRHIINPARRTYNNMKYLDVPNKNIHNPNFDFSQWTLPPYRGEFYQQRIEFKKPTLIISNKYNVEWGEPPINYIDLHTLERLFYLLNDKYQIVYNHMTSPMGFDDTVDSLDMGEMDMVNNFAGVLTMQKLMEQHKTDYNTLQLRIYAACSRFISVQGGSSIFSSFYGGKNLIFARKGFELANGTYKKTYTRLSDSQIFLAHSWQELYNMAGQIF